MIFTDIPAGAVVFLDANVLVYHFAPDPVLGPACRDLLVRIKRQEVDGCTSTHILSEVAHRLMTIEAMKSFRWPVAGIAQRLRTHPDAVQKLTAFRQAIQEVLQFGVRVLTVPTELIDTASAVSQQTGLLSNDALVVAVMQHYGVQDLASHDADFDRVTGITRFAPA